MSAKKKILDNIKNKPYFVKDNFVLYKSDCLKILEQLPENSIDMIFADPPQVYSITMFSSKNTKFIFGNKSTSETKNTKIDAGRGAFIQGQGGAGIRQNENGSINFFT